MLRWFSRIIKKNRTDWESHCHGCGLCCYEKGYYRHRIYIDLDHPCRYLDETDMRCTIYQHRFTTYRECKKVGLYHALFCTYLPRDCGYVRRFRPWRRWFNGPLYHGSNHSGRT